VSFTKLDKPIFRFEHSLEEEKPIKTDDDDDDDDEEKKEKVPKKDQTVNVFVLLRKSVNENDVQIQAFETEIRIKTTK